LAASSFAAPSDTQAASHGEEEHHKAERNRNYAERNNEVPQVGAIIREHEQL
jgi:hypothetical protein